MKDQGIFAKLAAVCALVASFALGGCASKSPAPLVERGGLPVTALPGKELYIIKRGDTLYSIALDHGLDYKELIVWNSIENPNRIQVGQTLRIRAPGAAAGGDVAVARPIVTVPSVEKRSLDGETTEILKREPKAGKEAYSEQALAQAQGAQKPVESAVVAAAKPETKPEVKPEAKPEQKPAEAASGPDEFVWIWPANGKMVGTFSDGASKGVDIAGKAGDPVLAAGDGKVVYSGTGLRGYGKLVIVKHNNTYLSAYAHNQSVLVKEGQAVSKGQKIAEMGNTDADQVKLHFEVRRQGKPVDPLKYLPQR